jgi:hypothetical protein
MVAAVDLTRVTRERPPITRRTAAISLSVTFANPRRVPLTLRRLPLAGPHPGIDAGTEQQIPMFAALDNASAVEHDIRRRRRSSTIGGR